MSPGGIDYPPEEMASDLHVLSESKDPLVRVIYHMGMRQLALSERMVLIENRLDRILDAFQKTGSRSDLRAVKT